MSKNVKKSDGEKKPIYKKWWFWVIIVVVIIAIGSAAGNDAEKVGEVGDNNNSSQSSNNGGSSQNEFKVGDVIAFDGREVTVTSVQRNFYTGNQFIKPSDGKEFVKVNVTIENETRSRCKPQICQF